MFSLSGDKALGLDGVTVEFLQLFWDILKDEMVLMFGNFIEKALHYMQWC